MYTSLLCVLVYTGVEVLALFGAPMGAGADAGGCQVTVCSMEPPAAGDEG